VWNPVWMLLSGTLDDGTVTLRPIVPDDGPAVLDALSNDPSVARWTRVPWPYTRAHLEEFLHAVTVWHAGTSDLALGIVDHETQAFLGCIGLHRIGLSRSPRSAFLPDEVGYWVSKEARGRGVATSALQLLARFGLCDLGRPRLNLQTKVGNAPSAAVARRVGFRFVARVPATDVDDDDSDHDRFVLTAADLLDVEPSAVVSPSVP